MLYYPYKTMFSAYWSVIVTPCACDLFVSKVTKITRYMDVHFWRSFFGAFSVCNDCIFKSTTAWLRKLSVLYIHSFMQVHNTTFQIKTVFNYVLFSTEVHNPLHAHLLALSHVGSARHTQNCYVEDARHTQNCDVEDARHTQNCYVGSAGHTQNCYVEDAKHTQNCYVGIRKILCRKC